MTTKITTFTIDFYEDVLALWQQCEGIGLNDADSRENMQAYLNLNPEMSFVAVADDRVVGSILAGHDGRRGYINHLAVHPSCRLQGIGRALVVHATDALRSKGIQKAHIFIFNTNASGAAFWESVGWTSRDDIAVMSKVLAPGS
ncbi:MAG: GNAT family N-acetyltransferase [Desulfopila sp.]|nr:GNAT family N-acetyltransferase [Desulfopila sp.]